MQLNRRMFLGSGSAALGAAVAGISAPHLAGAETGKTYRAAIIGATGAGNYGHAYDQIFSDQPNVSVEAIADADPEGLMKAAQRAGAKRRYLDYREMLQKEKPELVCIATRHTTEHKNMALAAISVGAHLIMEKPITDSLEEADAILAAADSRGLKIAMAHKQRHNAWFHRIKLLIEDGFIGTPVEVRGSGSQDSRVGGEDMIVLGIHEFDIIRWYFGHPLWCSASVTAEGRDITADDVREGRGEPVLVAGDTVRASYALPNNLQFHWSSVRTPEAWRGRRGITIFGTQRIIAFHHGPGAAYLDSSLLMHSDQKALWRPLPEPPNTAPHVTGLVPNLIHAIETDTPPLSSGHDGRGAVEMVHAAYESQRARSRVELPLQERRHPLSLLGHRSPATKRQVPLP